MMHHIQYREKPSIKGLALPSGCSTIIKYKKTFKEAPALLDAVNVMNIKSPTDKAQEPWNIITKFLY